VQGLASAVKKEQVLAFKATLEDLPGQPRGIVVSRKGFQEGAREFAAGHGILLYELREPEDRDWDGYVREVHLHMEVHAPVVHAFRLVLDSEWARIEKARLGLPAEPIPVEFRATLGQTLFLEEDGSVFANAGDLVEGYAPGAEKRVAVEHRFDRPIYMTISHPILKRIRVVGFDVDIEDAIAMRQVVRIDANELVAFILKNVADGSFRSLDVQGRPL
jgi:hypothetical protein